MEVFIYDPLESSGVLNFERIYLILLLVSVGLTDTIKLFSLCPLFFDELPTKEKKWSS